MENYIYEIAISCVNVLIPFTTIKFILNYLRQFLFNDQEVLYLDINSVFDFSKDETYSIFLPKEYLDYKYMINCTSDYIDLVNVPFIASNTSYDYIRVYCNREGFVQEKQANTNNYTTITTTPVTVSNSFFARRDCFFIMGSALILVISIRVIFNCVTEFIQKGGLF